MAPPNTPPFNPAYARRYRVKAVRVLTGSDEYPEELRVEETYRFAPSGQLLSHRNPGLEEAKANTRSGPDYELEEEEDALGRVCVSRQYINEELRTITYSTYDARSQLVCDFSINPSNATLLDTSCYIYVNYYAYDARGNQVEAMTAPYSAAGLLNLGGRTVSAYDAQNRVVAVTSYEHQFLPTNLDSTSYNAVGLVTRQARYDLRQGAAPTLTTLQLITYDDRNRVTSSTNLDPLT